MAYLAEAVFVIYCLNWYYLSVNGFSNNYAFSLEFVLFLKYTLIRIQSSFKNQKYLENQKCLSKILLDKFYRPTLWPKIDYILPKNAFS